MPRREFISIIVGLRRLSSRYLPFHGPRGIVVFRRREHSDAARRLRRRRCATKRAVVAWGCSRVNSRNGQIYLVSVGVGRNRMGPSARRGSSRVLSRDHGLVGAMAVRVDDPELFIGHVLAAGEEVMAVTFVEPDFVVTAKVRELSNDRTALLVDDNGVRMSVRRRCVTA